MFFNVREDATFVEAPYLEQGERCIAWIESAMREPLLILEIGAGFNTPGVVRYPLERLASQHADARFVRINREDATVPASLANRALGIAGDAGEVVASVWFSVRQLMMEKKDARGILRNTGPAREVLKVGTMADPTPGPGELRIRVAASGINPGDIKKRQDAFGYCMPYPRVVPHSDGAGAWIWWERTFRDRIGRRVWCYGAQSYRPFGTAADYAVLPAGRPCRCRTAFHLSRRVPGHSRHHRASLCSCCGSGGRAAPSWCRVALARSAPAPCSSRVVQARLSSRPSVVAGRIRARKPAHIMFSGLIPT